MIAAVGGSTGTQVLVLVVAGLILAALTWIGRIVSKALNDSRVESREHGELLRDLTVAIGGEKPTMLNPNPGPGLAAKVEDQRGVLENIHRDIAAMTGRYLTADGPVMMDFKKRLELLEAWQVQAESWRQDVERAWDKHLASVHATTPLTS